MTLIGFICSFCFSNENAILNFCVVNEKVQIFEYRFLTDPTGQLAPMQSMCCYTCISPRVLLSVNMCAPRVCLFKLRHTGQRGCIENNNIIKNWCCNIWCLVYQEKELVLDGYIKLYLKPLGVELNRKSHARSRSKNSGLLTSYFVNTHANMKLLCKILNTHSFFMMYH